MPNSKLLGGNVSNLTLSDNRIWSSVTVSVDRGFPVADIKDSLLAAVQMHPRVAVNPAPFVLFTDFGDKSLKFEVHFSIAMQHMTDARRIESDLREAIEATFREAGFIQDTAAQAVRSGGATAAICRCCPDPIPGCWLRSSTVFFVRCWTASCDRWSPKLPKATIGRRPGLSTGPSQLLGLRAGGLLRAASGLQLASGPARTAR